MKALNVTPISRSVLFFFAALSFALVHLPSHAFADEPIKVSAILSLTGMAAADGEDTRKAMELAAEELKHQGISLKFSYHDDKTTPKDAVTAAHFISSQEKPDVVIGPIWSFLGEAAFPVIAKNKLFNVTPVTTSEVSIFTSPCLFYMAPKFRKQGEAVGKWLTETKIKNVAIVTTSDSWGDLVYAVFQEGLKASGAREVSRHIVDYIGYEQGLDKFISDAARKKADALFFSNGGEGNHYLIRKLRERKISLPVLGTTNFFSTFTHEGAQVLAEEEFYAIVDVMNPEFVKRFTDRYNQPPRSYADRGYDAVKLATSVILESRRTGADKCELMRNNEQHPQLSPHYVFDQNGDTDVSNWKVVQITGKAVSLSENNSSR